MWNRRQAFGAFAGAGLAGLASPAAASPVVLHSLRGSLDAGENGIAPGLFDDQSEAFSRLLARAAEAGAPIFLPAGNYVVSGLVLPHRVWLSGVPGATRIILGRDGHLLAAYDTEQLTLSGLTFDGATRSPAGAKGLLDFRRVQNLAIGNCVVTASGGNGLALEACRGRVDSNQIAGAAEAGLYSVQARGLEIVGNTVSDCGNGGILVHRWEVGEDGTIVSGNRIERIASTNGGTGQFGNGVNVYRAGGVIVANNHVADCSFSAIRSNSGSNVQITGNNCSRSGETAIYSEFAFEGAVISSNIVDGAANGISIVNFNEGGRMAVCSGNLVRNLRTEGPYRADPPGFGVGITAEAETAITGNVIENAPRYGMHIGWGPYLRNVVATGNVIRNAGEGIAVTVVEGAGTAVITDNVISDVERGAIVGHRWTESVGDLAGDGSSSFPHLTLARNHAG
jgi:uncharacterized secreted repeat protein (TIGR03808 family)